MNPQYFTQPIKFAFLSALTLFFACAVMTVSANAMPGNALVFKADRLATAALIEVAQSSNSNAPSGQPAPHNEAAAALQTMLNEAQAIYQSCREADLSRAECAQARRAFFTSKNQPTGDDADTTIPDDLPQ